MSEKSQALVSEGNREQNASWISWDFNVFDVKIKMHNCDLENS